ncbi:MAG: rRNA maturation RNase YbeY [Thermoguttaceae bacterium]|nr:rRNA maturation RNase YbeY [Thermoguttaceae bacterium]
MYSITITNQQDEYSVNESLIHDAVQTALKIHGVVNAVMDIAILDPDEMQKVNVRHLGHDYPADVLSFLLEETDDSIEGEVLVCPAVASEWSKKYGWEPENELVLYAVHGTLHLVGFDDLTPEDEAEMRAAEREVLAEFNLVPPWDMKDGVADGSDSDV